jgi:endonuclease YncB( thermonuclease family)
MAKRPLLQRGKRAMARASLRPFVYTFPATVDVWTDGDTLLCFRGVQPGVVMFQERVRVQGINTPDRRTVEGKAALAYAVSLAPKGSALVLTCTKQEKYGRLLARIMLSDGTDFGDRMIAAGHAVPYLT